MAVGVIDLFEVIHIQHHRTQGKPVVLTVVEQQLGILKKSAAILQSSEFIGLCGIRGNAMGPFHFTR
ncbi:hypothetical protein D3C78_1842750 [compost metagenome]